MGEKRRVCLIGPATGRTHMERILHHLMYEDRDYDRCSANEEVDEERKQITRIKKGSSRRCGEIQVEIETCDEKAYSVVNIMIRDRPKLLFDTVCMLTDMQYVVFHATISSKGSLTTQPYTPTMQN